MGGASRILMLLSTPSPLSSPSSSSTAVLRLARRHRSRLPHSTSIRQLSLKSKSNPSPFFPPKFSSTRARFHTQTNSNFIDPLPPPIPKTPSFSHPWPEWSTLLDRLASAGYSDRPRYGDGAEDDSFVEDVPEEFARAAEACLAFARDRPDLLRLLSKKNIEVIVENGLPFLFRDGRNSERRMRLFLSGGGSNVIESEKVQTFDVMRYVLSYAYSSLSTSDGNVLKGGELVEVSIRSLLGELINLSGTVKETKLSDSVPRHASGHEQFSRSPGQNIEMKRGDWICSKCSFMNFARNTRCLECDEVRPKRQLTGAEWECPQCDFFNYGKNMSCLRCDCKRPGETQSSTGYGSSSIVDRILGGSNIDKSELERRLAVNDEKAEKWFSKVSQLDDAADSSSAGADEDFPEIMPLRKGVNKFVVSNRKTPLERRLDNSQSGIASGVGSNRPSDSSISQSLDRILGRTSAPATGEENTGTSGRFNSSDYSQSIAKADPNHVPFVPLPPDMFKKPQNSSNEAQHKEDTAPINAGGHGDSMSMSIESPTQGKKDGELSDASDKWFKKTADADLDSTVPDDDFPDIMPMRKGENRFVVSKKKDRSLTSPQYKRRLAIEQANTSNFVPFVPFPPDYFAKKDKQPEGAPVSNKEATAETSGPPERVQTVAENLQENKVGVPNWGSAASATPNQTESKTHNDSYSTQFSGKNTNDMKVDNSGGSWNSGLSPRGNASNGVNVTGGFAQQSENPQNGRDSWNKGFSGKSLEGSAVKETDPLDMSEEAKAERWFRRVAQIKDISELSQIPDEDFPEIMPMRKGVNRFVVSKRKTPLERRLTSPQYRRNLPIVSSDPEKDDS